VSSGHSPKATQPHLFAAARCGYLFLRGVWGGNAGTRYFNRVCCSLLLLGRLGPNCSLLLLLLLLLLLWLLAAGKLPGSAVWRCCIDRGRLDIVPHPPRAVLCSFRAVALRP